MVQILEQQGNIFGRIGKGLGKGLAESIPKSIERGQLSAGLKQLQNQPNGTPFEQASYLQSLPGATPEMINSVLPLLQQQAAVNEARQLQQKPSSVSPQANAGVGQQNATPIEKFERLKSTPEAIREGAVNYLNKYPAKFKNNLAAAEAQYKEDALNQESKINKVREFFDKATPQLLNADPNGEVADKFREKAEEQVLSGKMTADQAGREYSKKMLDFDKSRDKQITQGLSWWDNLFSANPLKKLQAAKKAYQEAELPELFRNDLITYQKLSPQGASEIAVPLTPKSESFFKKLKRGDSNAYNEALNNLTEKDSVLNFAKQLDIKGYDPQKFLDMVQEKEDLQPFQIRELQDRNKLNPSIGDLFYFAFSRDKNFTPYNFTGVKEVKNYLMGDKNAK